VEDETDEGAPAPSSSPAHARAIPTAPPVPERIELIVGMMERLEWVRGKSAAELATSWGLATATVEGNAAEASRRIIGDPDEARRDITAGCRKLFKHALDNNLHREAKAVGDLWADVSGAKAPTKQEIGIGMAASPTEAARLVRESFGAHAAQQKPDGGPDKG